MVTFAWGMLDGLLARSQDPVSSLGVGASSGGEWLLSFTSLEPLPGLPEWL